LTFVLHEKYNQLNLGQRYQIECLLGLGYNQSEIAKMLGRDMSTISLEISRITGNRGIRAGEVNFLRLNKYKANVYEGFPCKLGIWMPKALT